MDSFFSPGFFTKNRAALRQAVGSDIPIVITGNGQMQRSGDEPEKFHQDSSFWYLTGLSNPDLLLIMLAHETYLVVPTLSFEREAFDGAHDVATYVERSGVDAVLDERAGWNRLRDALKETDRAATLLSAPSFMKRHGLHTVPYRRRLTAKLKRMRPDLTLQDIRPELVRLRCMKQPEELRAIQQAIDITTETLNEIASGGVLTNASREYQVEAALTFGFRSRGAADHAFWPIVGAGPHSTTLHHFENSGPIASDDIVILDVGAEVEHYASDIARTVSKQPLTGRKAEIFKAVATVQDYAISLIKPGALPIEYEKNVESFLGEQLRKLGVIKTDKHEDIRHYFPHATSHFLGLDTHDVGDYRAPWQENMVITCEPGIYIPEEGIGVRIEDDVLITADGCKVLSSACPRELTQVQ